MQSTKIYSSSFYFSIFVLMNFFVMWFNSGIKTTYQFSCNLFIILLSHPDSLNRDSYGYILILCTGLILGIINYYFSNKLFWKIILIILFLMSIPFFFTDFKGL